MNLFDAACFKVKQRRRYYSEKHSKVFSHILRFEEIYLDELSELMNLSQKETKEILDKLIERKLVKQKNYKYFLTEPFDSANSFLFKKN